MGMIIRVAFNNQNWSSRCTNVRGDRRFFKCRERAYATGYKLDEKSNCLADCWESTLCTKYFWESTIGNFGNKAEGNVFFVYPDVDNSLVLWGKSVVDRVEGDRIYFREFKAMPTEKWVRNLSAKQILGKNWGQPTFRYLNDDQEDFLLGLLR